MTKAMNKGLLIVVSGPSGVGKGTICKELLKTQDIFFSVSATTRKAREGEIDGINYFFKTEDDFKKMIENKELLEWAPFCESFYGTPKAAVLEKLENGTDVLLEIDVQGALQVRKHYPEGVYIFVLPPNMQELERRIRGRATETEEVIKLRLSKASNEIDTVNKYNYIVINDDVEAAVFAIKSIITAEKHRIERNQKFINEVILNAIPTN